MLCETSTISASPFCLHFSAAFDTINFEFLADRLKVDFGIDGVALFEWLLSFLIDKTQNDAVGSSRSTPVACLSGVPQGSVLDPLLFTLYFSPVNNVVSANRLHLHQYADDILLYMAVRPADNSPLEAASQCVSDVSSWFPENGMLLNPNKTEAVLFGTRPQRKKIDTSAGIDVTGANVAFSPSVKFLGVTLDEDLTLDRHITEISAVVATSREHLRHIRPLIDLPTAGIVA